MAQVVVEQQSKPISKFDSVTRRIASIGAVITAAAVGVMMIATVADVAGRYFFLHPIDGTNEIVAILLVLAGTCGMGWCELNRGHIRINMISDRFPPRGRAILYIIASLICITVSVVVCWQVSLMVHQNMFAALGAGNTVRLHIPLWPFQAVVVLTFAWLIFVLIIGIVKDFREVIKR